MKYEECREWLENRRKKMGSVPGMTEVERLLDEYKRPDADFPLIHIAGTNGKGSVGYLLENVLYKSKYKVGRFLSPAVVDEREIILVNGKMVPKTVWAKILSGMIETIEKKGLNATAFEIEFVLSLLIFKEVSCDIVILECGMGGRLDATNAIEKSLVDIITSISIDHTNFLGDSIEDISLHKFGIIKPGSKNAVLSPQTKEVEEIFDKYMSDKKDICAVRSDREACRFKTGKKAGKISQTLSYKEYKDLTLSLYGLNQRDNAVCVLDAVDVLKKEGYNISEKTVRTVFENAVWPARFEIIEKGHTYILDGAHNADAVRVLFENINLYFTNRNLIYIMGMYKDKAYEEVVRDYASFAKAIVTVTPKDSARALEAFELGKCIKEYNENVTASDSYYEALEIANLLADKKDVILIFGSLSFMGEFRKMILNEK